MGLPGAGKTTLADEIAPLINAKRLNADEVRKAANDWIFQPKEECAKQNVWQNLLRR